MNHDHHFTTLIAAALRNELESSRLTVKSIMRWTGASERTVKNWLAGTHGPSGEHLVQLAKHSDEIFELVLLMADRKPVVTTMALIRLRTHLQQTIERLDRHIV
jgi:hypothetical protein